MYTRLDCKASLNTNVFDIIVTCVGIYHHQPEIETIQRQLVVNSMKMQISTNPTMPVKRVFDVVREFRVGAVNNRVPPPETASL